MGVRATVFGSKEEKRYYLKLQKTWGDKCIIYHNMPFLNVFTAKEELLGNNLEIFQLTDEEYDQLKKTSIDYVICDKKDKPIACIEFDGLQQGFNVGTSYVVSEERGKRKWRKHLLELKLKVAHGSLFPFFILGSEHFRGLSSSVYLTIADALIGEVLSTQARIKTIDSGFDPSEYGYTQDEFCNLDEIKKTSLIEDWALGVEVESDFVHNPIFQKVAELSKETGSNGFTVSFLNDNIRNKHDWTWVECEVTNHKYGNAKANVCLPNFNTPSCYFSVHLAQEIAQLLALEQIKQRMK
jgi:hypothetical protein